MKSPTNEKTQKKAYVILLLVASLFLMGSAFYQVEFKKGIDNAHPLVSLDEIIRTGGSHLPGDATSAEASDSQAPGADVPAEVTSQAGAALSQTNPVKQDAEIVVRGTGITYNGRSKSEDALYAYLDASKRQGTHVVIDNKYADYKLYSRIQRYLDDNGINDYEFKE